MMVNNRKFSKGVKSMRFWRSFALMMFALALLWAAPNMVPSTVSTEVYAQDDSVCQTLVRDAVREIGSACRDLGRNEACYGNTSVIAELIVDDQQAFDESGDIIDVSSLLSLTTTPANPATNEWGIALLDLLVDLPENDTNNLRMVVFGGVEVDPVSPAANGYEETCTLTNNRSQRINLRVGPDTSFAIVEQLNSGESLIGYGISADGEWVRTAKGWIFASLTNNDCAGQSLPVITEASDAYLAPMQNFTLTVGRGGSCEAVPDGLLVQAPEGTTANIMVNNVEIRLGSTAFITMDNTQQELIVANFDGDVVTTVEGQSRRLRVGEETTIPLEENEPTGGPTFPRPFTDEARKIDENLINLLPEPFPVPSPASQRTVNDALDTGRSASGGSSSSNTATTTAPGRWLGCGSCNTCGYPDLECVTDPSGQCLWDPATCRDAFITESGQSLKGPFSIDCVAYSSDNLYRLVYADRLGQYTLADAYVDSPSKDANLESLAPYEMFVSYDCPFLGGSETVTVTAFDTKGNVLIWQTVLYGK